MGVGKSTLVRRMMDEMAEEEEGIKVAHISEAVDVWRNFHGEDLLQRAIDVGDNLLEFQMLVLTTYREAFNKCREDGVDIVLLERSPMSAVHVFTRLAAEEGKLTPVQHEIIKGAYGVINAASDATHVVCLWNDKADEELFFAALNDRVYRRDGPVRANEGWNRRVFNAYRGFFEDFVPNNCERYYVIDPLQRQEDIVREMKDFMKTYEDIFD